MHSHQRSRLSAVLVAIAACLALPTQAADWPQWRGPDRTAQSTETGLLDAWPEGGPALAWHVEGLGAGYSSVAIADGRIFTLGDIGDDQFVFALDATDGRQLWRQKTGGKWECQYGFHGSRSTPTIDGDRLYALDSDGNLSAYATADGRRIWHRNLPKDFGGKLMNDLWAWSESPLIDGDHVIVAPGGPEAALVALDKATGETVWQATMPALGEKGADGAGFSSAIISHAAGVKQIVQLFGRGVAGFDAATGEFLWGYNGVANHIANIPTPVAAGDYVFASTSYDTGTALLHITRDEETGKVSAEEVYFLKPDTMQNHHGGFVLLDGVIYTGNGHNKGFPLAIEMKTGEILWGPVRNEGKGSAAVAYVDGHLIYRYQSGHVVLIEANPKAYVQKGVFELPELVKESWPHPAIADGKLYLRENDHLWVYDLKQAPTPQPAEEDDKAR
ncbi:MAG: PQQ-binding-like beta-propeller repeat protein [Acidobacteriota bacterium]